MKTDSELTAKFSNIYINLLYCVMTKDLNKVRHFLGEQVALKYQGLIDALIANNETQLYDELNVGKIDIIDRKEQDNKKIITVKILSRYMNYKLDSNGNYKSGNNKFREEHENILTFVKDIDATSKNYYRCKYCGNNLDINFTGECPYCNKVYNMEDHDYQLIDIEVK